MALDSTIPSPTGPRIPLRKTTGPLSAARTLGRAALLPRPAPWSQQRLPTPFSSTDGKVKT
jgi:hypothetical protein